MIKNGTSSLFGEFSIKDKKIFKLFLLSPYHNKSRQLVSFYEIITRNRSKQRIELSHEKISAKLYPGKKFNDSTIRNLFSDLNKAASEFLASENFNRTKRTKFLFLQNELSRRNLTRDFEKTTLKLEAECSDDIDFNYFYIKHHAEANKFNFSYNNSNILRSKNTENEIKTINKSTAYLTYYYITELTSHFITSKIY